MWTSSRRQGCPEEQGPIGQERGNIPRGEGIYFPGGKVPMERYLETFGPVSTEITIDQSMFGDLDRNVLLSVIQSSGRSVMWAYGTGGSIANNPVVHQGTVYFGCCDHIFYAVDREGRKVWEFKTNGLIFSSPRIEGGRIYFGSCDKNFYCLSLEGKLVWRFSAGDSIGANPEVAGGRIFFGCKDGNLYCLSLEGKLLWKFRTLAPIPGDDPVCDGDSVYFSSEEQNFYCAEAATGKLRWKFPTKGPILFRRPILQGNVVVVGSTDNTVYALDKRTGSLLWKTALRGHPRNGVTDGKRFFILSRDHTIYALSLEGKLLWTFKAENIWIWDPLIHQGVLYAGNGDGNLYAIAVEGKLLWKFHANGPIVSVPAVDGDRLYFGCNDCNVYCIDLKGNLVWKFPTSMGTPSPIDVDRLGPPQSLRLTATQVEEPVAGEDRYKAQPAAEGGTSQYVVKSDYIVQHKYTKGRKIKSMTSGWGD